MTRCPRCGFHELDNETAAKRIHAFLTGVPELHRTAYTKVFKSIRLMSSADTTCDELAFLERMAYEAIPSRTVLEVMSSLMDDPRVWSKVKHEIERKLPYLAETIVNIVKRSRRRTTRHVA